jgi:predicted AAA+ superfamily ATPase
MAGAGRTPAYLAGREQIIANAAQSFETLKAGFPERSVIYYGLRGVGKTVLLNALEDLAEEMDIPSSYMEVSEAEGSFHKAIAITSYKLLHEISKSEKAKSYVKKAFGILKAFP